MIDTRNVQALLLKGMQERITGELVFSFLFFYIQKSFYNFTDILLHFLIITLRHYGDDIKRIEILLLAHGYMKQNEEDARKLYAKKQRGNKDLDDKHKSK